MKNLIEFSENIAGYICTFFGEKYLDNYIDYFNSDYSGYLRISSLIDNWQEIIERLKKYDIKLEQVESVPNAYSIIGGSEVAGKTLEFILGKYYIQSLSSMIPALVLQPDKNDMVLDLCAAPGSKTTQLADMMGNKGTLYANEISVDRIKSLVFNIEKMNLVNVGVINKKGELLSKIFQNYFDKILVDAPCSALGILQKKGEVNNWWNINKIPQFSDIQFRLLLSAFKMCKIGGEIVYSTCTLTLEENELVLNKLLKNYPAEICDIELPVKSHEAFVKYNNESLHEDISKARRILPWEINSEGFFIAKIKKNGKVESTSSRSFANENKFELQSYNKAKIKNLLSGLKETFEIDDEIFSQYKYLVKKNDIFFVDNDWQADNTSDFMRIGSRFGLIDKRNQVQLNSLATQIIGKYANKNIIELENLDELDVYLKGGTIKKDVDKVGQKLIKYGNGIIGTVAATTDGLKSQFPRAFRTQEIVLK